MSATSRPTLAAVALALGVALLAWVEPVETVSGDAALTLVAAQALVEHGSFTLDAYRDDERLAYDLAHDYRVRRRGGSFYYFAPGAQVLSAPFVFVARRLGLDMLRPQDEAALQNLLSALLCGLNVGLLFLVLRRLVTPGVALGVTAVTVLGSPLVSTLATSLWSAAFAVPLLLLALLVLVRDAARPDAPTLRAAALAAVPAALAFLCRPAAACFFPGLLAYAWPVLRRHVSRRALAWGLATAVAGVLAVGPYLPNYYRLTRALPQTPLLLGLYGVLASPSRGLLVFCPFLAVIAAGWWRSHRASVSAPVPAGERALVALAVTWLATQVLLVAVRGNWWGGHSYGPRLLLEVLPAAAVLTALLWRRLAEGRRRALGTAYAACALVAVAIHSGQGLFNPATQAWNRGIDLGTQGELALLWRYPQFLASEANVRQRDLDWQERRLEPLRPGDVVGALSRQAVFVDWHPYEVGWRPSGRHSVIRLRPAGFDADRVYVLELRGGVREPRAAVLHLDGRPLGTAVYSPPEPHVQRFVVPPPALHVHGDVELSVEVPAAAAVGPLDPRVTGVNLHALRFAELRPIEGRLHFHDDPYFARGFGDTEGGGRWTRAAEAEILLPLAPGSVPVPEHARRCPDAPHKWCGASGRCPDAPHKWCGASGRCRLVIEAAANGTQPVELALDGVPLASFTFTGGAAQSAAVYVARERLKPGALQRLTLRLPRAHALPGDARLLGLYFVGLTLGCGGSEAPPAGG